jgi:heme exporter protein D
MEPHADFIAAAYAFTGLVIAGLVLFAVQDYRAQIRRLAELEARGFSRRPRRG